MAESASTVPVHGWIYGRIYQQFGRWIICLQLVLVLMASFRCWHAIIEVLFKSSLEFRELFSVSNINL
jgi:hypothetical protein